jgi:hypothetical protein
MWCVKDGALSVGLIKTEYSGFVSYTYILQGRIFLIYLLCLHPLDLSVTIQMICPHLIITLTVMLDSWQEFNVAANNTKSCDELKATPLHYTTPF